MKVSEKGQYYGIKKKELDLNNIFLSQYTYEDKSTDWHCHENPYLMYVISGNIKDHCKKGYKLCPSGSLIFQNWDEQHLNTRESRYASGFHLELDRKWLHDNIPYWEMSQGQKHLNDPKIHVLLGRIYFEFHKNDKWSKASLEALNIQLCEAIAHSNKKQETKKPSWLDHLVGILHGTDEIQSLEALSLQLGVHPVHLSRAIPKYLGITLGAYMRTLKITNSLSAVMDMNMPLSDIAYDCGFADQSHFIRVFKDKFGVSPGQYRQMVRR